MKIEKRWIFAFSLITILAVLGLFWEKLGFHGQTSSEFLGEEAINYSDVAWVLTSACLVLLMTPGLSFFYGGMVGKKNVISTMLQSFICLGVVSLLWVAVGFSMAFGDPLLYMDTTVMVDGVEESVRYSFLGNPLSFAFLENVGTLPHSAMASTIPFVLFAIFQMKFAIITPAIITGSFAERVRFISYLVFISLFSLVIYTPLCHMIWHPSGFLGLGGYFKIADFAGGTVVHMSAGFAALAGAMFLGKRKKFSHEPTNIPFVILGTGMLWFGWFGFNAGSALGASGDAAKAFITTNSASAAAMLTWIFFDRLNGRKVSALGACIGAVVGLVAITPAAGFVTVPQSIFFGFITALVSNVLVNWSAMNKLDDTLDVFACHGVGGIMGMILTAIFADGEGIVSWKTEGFGAFSSHMLALLLVSVFTLVGAFLLYKVTDMIIPLRVTADAEEMGLDLSQHDESI